MDEELLKEFLEVDDNHVVFNEVDNSEEEADIPDLVDIMAMRTMNYFEEEQV